MGGARAHRFQYDGDFRQVHALRDLSQRDAAIADDGTDAVDVRPFQQLVDQFQSLFACGVDPVIRGEFEEERDFILVIASAARWETPSSCGSPYSS